MSHWVVLALAGAVGTLARAGVTSLAVRVAGTTFPWGTLLVNVGGALAFGAVVGVSRARIPLPHSVETALLVGLLGGFTTFSSYAFQSLELWQQGRPLAATAYVVVSNAAALAAVWAGLRLSG